MKLFKVFLSVLFMFLFAVKVMAVEVDYKDNFYVKTSDNKFRLDIYGYGQVRYTYQTNNIAGTKNISNFQVQRTRLGFKGNVYSDKLRYQLLLSASQAGQFDTVSLLDWFIDYNHTKEINVKAGQFKVPFSTSFTISAADLQFVERPQVDSAFRLDRDNGINLYGKVLESRLAYNAGIYNGEGRNKANPDAGMLYSGRVLFEPFGKYAYHESDNEMSEKLLMLFSAAVAASNDQAGSTNTSLNTRLSSLGVSDVSSYDIFFGIKQKGLSFHTEYYRRVIDPADSGMDDETGHGYYLQGGYFFVPKTIEAAIRYEFYDLDKHTSDNNHKEYGVAFNYFFNGHRNKIQADLFKISDDLGVDGNDDNRFRVQYQLAF